jgi:hypothetical protein
MEIVTQITNVKRGGFSLKTHCPQGHPYNEANTHRWTGKRGTMRTCRICNRQAVERYRQKQRASRIEVRQ